MFLSRWLRRRPGLRQTHSQRRVRPALCQLEDRTTPSTLLPFPPSAPATHFAVSATGLFQAGRPAAVLVQAEDANNLPAFGYMGTVQFTLANTDVAASLPANYTFTFRDHGKHSFLVTLVAPGSQTVTVTDTTTNSITGSANVRVAPAPAATRFVVQMPTHAPAGLPVNVTVVAEDAIGRRAWTYAGAVAFSSSDTQAMLPGHYQFTPQDLGRHTFQVVFNTAGSESVKITDTASSSIKGSAGATVMAAPVPTHFVLYGLHDGPAGTAETVTIVAVDVAGRLSWNYAGTVSFSSTDSHAVLPGPATFSGGRLTASVVFNTAGSQTLTVTALTGTPISGHQSLNVSAQTIHFYVYAQSSATVGSPLYLFVVALDADNRPVLGYTGTVHFTSTDGNASLPIDYTFLPSDHGRHLFQVDFTNTGAQTVTLTDKSNSSLTINVNVQVS
jgi:hypothetical protein